MMMRASAVLILGLCIFTQNVLAADNEKNSPVTKVVTLLKDMVAQLEKEAKEDAEVYETMGCWCETNEKGKTKAIADAKVKIQELISEAERNTGLSATLNSEIATLQEELAKNTK